MIATILVAAVAIGVAVFIGAITAPRYLPYFPRKRGRASEPATDQAAICVTTETRWCWCREGDLPEASLSQALNPEKDLPGRETLIVEILPRP